MGKPIPHEVRRQIVRLREQGRSQTLIAEEVGYTLSAVKKLLKKHRQTGDSAYQTQYLNCGRNAPERFEEAIVAAVKGAAQSTRGGPMIYSLLVSQQPGKAIPHYRTMQRWWAKSKKGTQRPALPPRARERWATEPHHTWQIDGKEGIELSDKTQVSWMNIADEATSTVLQTTVFPPGAGG